MPTAKHWDTALVCKMLLGGEKKKIRTKTPPVPTCARLSFKLKIRYISILHPVKKKCIFCTQKRLKNTQNKKKIHTYIVKTILFLCVLSSSLALIGEQEKSTKEMLLPMGPFERGSEG